MKNNIVMIALLSLITAQASGTDLTNYNNIDLLKSRYRWPDQKPAVQPDGQSMFGNSVPLFVLLNGKMKLIVELGSWLGGSTRFFLDNAPNATVIAIDHWLGSEEHQLIEMFKKKLDTLYETFLVNCWKYKDRLIPLRKSTLEGLQEIHDCGLIPDMIYVDASHTYNEVSADLEKIHQLFPTTFITGDDWNWDWILVPEDKKPKNAMQYPTRQAVIDFATRHNFAIKAVEQFWMIIKD